MARRTITAKTSHFDKRDRDRDRVATGNNWKEPRPLPPVEDPEINHDAQVSLIH